MREVVEPLAYNDGNLVQIDPFYREIGNSCKEIWEKLPDKMKTDVYLLEDIL